MLTPSLLPPTHSVVGLSLSRRVALPPPPPRSLASNLTSLLRALPCPPSTLHAMVLLAASHGQEQATRVTEWEGEEGRRVLVEQPPPPHSPPHIYPPRRLRLPRWLSMGTVLPLPTGRLLLGPLPATFPSPHRPPEPPPDNHQPPPHRPKHLPPRLLLLRLVWQKRVARPHQVQG